MNASAGPDAAPQLPPSPPRTWWQRRIVDPVVFLLTQGVAPEKIAATLAVGTACSMFPLLGFTSLVTFGVGLWLRMNQPILHTLNQLLGPVHIVMIVVYVRAGEWIWSASNERFTVDELVRTFREDSLGEFFHRFGWAGVHAVTAWALSVPLILICVYYPLRFVLKRTAVP